MIGWTAVDVAGMQVEGNPVTGNHTAHRNAAQPLTSCEGGHAVASGTGSSVSWGERRAAPGDIPTVRLKARLNAASES